MMLTLSLRSDDEMFHVTLYSWLLSDSVNMADKLIEVCFQQFKNRYQDQQNGSQSDGVCSLEYGPLSLARTYGNCDLFLILRFSLRILKSFYNTLPLYSRIMDLYQIYCGDIMRKIRIIQQLLKYQTNQLIEIGLLRYLVLHYITLFACQS